MLRPQMMPCAEPLQSAALLPGEQDVALFQQCALAAVIVHLWTQRQTPSDARCTDGCVRHGAAMGRALAQ